MTTKTTKKPTTDKSNKKNFIDDNDVSIYKTKRTITTSLFTASTRPQHIQRMYELAAPTPVLPILCNLDTSSEDSFSVCPLSFGHTRRQIKRKIDAEIETRVVSEHRNIDTFYLLSSCRAMYRERESACFFLLLFISLCTCYFICVI